ncbi:MAG: hypothetical protein IJN17_02610 [Clostridia bacterium]|nr:hypothetical protein [Clostridia bacterium]
MITKELELLSPEDLLGAVVQLLEEGYDAEFTVTGTSMWPLLAHGRDRVTLRKTVASDVRKGDIVLYRAEQGYLLHRVMKAKKGVIKTAGDYNCYYDKEVSADCVLGKAVGFTRKGKHVLCSSLLYRMSSFVWRVMYPLRPLLLRLLLKFRRRSR